MKNFIKIIVFALIIFSFWACKKENNEPSVPTPEAVAPTIIGKWNMTSISDNINTNFSKHAICDNKTIYNISKAGIEVIFNSSCNVSQLEYRAFVNGFTYTLTKDEISLIDSPVSKVLDGTLGGHAEYNITFDKTGKTMVWSLIKNPRYNSPNYTYNWTFTKI